MSSRFGLGGDAADFEFGPAEVDRRTERLAPTSFRGGHVAQHDDHLEFDDGQVLDDWGGGYSPTITSS
jgi:hypothetical protein